MRSELSDVRKRIQQIELRLKASLESTQNKISYENLEKEKAKLETQLYQVEERKYQLEIEVENDQKKIREDKQKIYQLEAQLMQMSLHSLVTVEDNVNTNQIPYKDRYEMLHTHKNKLIELKRELVNDDDEELKNHSRRNKSKRCSACKSANKNGLHDDDKCLRVEEIDVAIEAVDILFDTTENKIGKICICIVFIKFRIYW